MDESDKCRRAINWAEWHHVIGPFGSVRAGKRQLYLGLLLDADLMITLRCIPQPHPAAVAEGEVDGRITARDRVSNGSSNLVEWDIIDAKSPHQIGNMADVFLVWLRREQGLKEPTTAVDLANVP